MRDGTRIYVLIAGEDWQEYANPDDRMWGSLRRVDTGEEFAPGGMSSGASSGRHQALLEFDDVPIDDLAGTWVLEVREAGSNILTAAGRPP